MTGWTAGVVQLQSTADVAANLAQAETLIRQGAAAGAEALFLPEGFAYLGPLAGRLAIAEDLPSVGSRAPAGPLLSWAQHLAQSLKVELFLGGFPEALDNARTYNTALHLDQEGRLKAAYRKLHLFSVDLPDGTRLDEGENTGAGEQLVLTNSQGFTVGLAICYDLRFPLLFERQRGKGATVLTVPSAFTESTGRAHWHPLLRARAIEQLCWLIAAAQCGDHGSGRRSFGHSLVIDPWGRVALALGEAPAVGLTTLTPSALSRARTALPALIHRR
ncbi:MAG: carbon-nitrogen hydrolase family protein, partial [Pseudomonadales bacterium]